MDGERDGIVQVGEIPVIRRRDRFVEDGHSQAFRSGREAALGDMLEYATGRLASTGRYEDTRPWSEMIIFIRDRIRDNGAST